MEGQGRYSGGTGKVVGNVHGRNGYLWMQDNVVMYVHAYIDALGGCLCRGVQSVRTYTHAYV